MHNPLPFVRGRRVLETATVIAIAMNDRVATVARTSRHYCWRSTRPAGCQIPALSAVRSGRRRIRWRPGNADVVAERPVVGAGSMPPGAVADVVVDVAGVDVHGDVDVHGEDGEEDGCSLRLARAT